MKNTSSQEDVDEIIKLLRPYVGGECTEEMIEEMATKLAKLLGSTYYTIEYKSTQKN